MLINSPKELALFVASQRKKINLSQTEVGERVGLKQKTISGFENKPESTKLATLFYILSAVNLDIKIYSKDTAGKIDKKWEQEW